MKTIEQYAIDLVAEGARSLADDDMNEDGEIADGDHEAARTLAFDIAHAIEANPHTVIGMARDYQESEDDTE